MDLAHLFGFLDLLERFRVVERRVRHRGEERLENDVEHSYQLAMAAWYVNEAGSLGLDTGLLLRYALAHDLVEAYAGDTPAYTRDAQERASKDAREAAAAERIAAEFPEFSELHDMIHAYEQRNDEEARFVYALDKLLPIINVYQDEGRTWHFEGVTLAMTRAYKAEKIAESPVVDKYFQELVALLEKNPGMFPKRLEGMEEVFES